MKFSAFFAIGLLFIVLTGCGGGGDCSAGLGAVVGGSGVCNQPGKAPVVNVAPVANAGPPQNVVVGTLVALDGSHSTDANADTMTYRWVLTTRPTGSTAALSSATAILPSFRADVAGAYLATLVVNDGTVESLPVTVTVTATVANAAPVANAGTAQNVVTGSVVTLDGSLSTDANSDTLTYQWVLTTRPTGSSATLSLATASLPTFTADVSGNYVATLRVNDGTVDSTAATVTITASKVNAAPVANAGLAQNVVTGAVVTLDGSTSTDANSDTLVYKWVLTSKPSTSVAVLSSGTDSKPTFTADVSGIYVASLVVNDGTVDSNSAQVVITAAVANSAPVANAGAAQSVLVGASVTLDASQSTDANKDVLTYKWLLFSKPVGSTAALSSTTAAKPTFTADIAGTYVARLIVNDGTIDSSISTVVVTAATGNAKPVADAGKNQVVANGTTVTLDGSASSDANHDTLSYKWVLLSKPSTSTAALSATAVAKPTFAADVPGTYVASLIVNDGTVDSAAVSVAVKSNAAPVAVAGADQTVKKGASAKLDGSKSTDENNDALTYRWILLSKPSGSVAALSDTASSVPTFTADVSGDYVVTLVVNDGVVDSAVVSVKITATGS